MVTGNWSSDAHEEVRARLEAIAEDLADMGRGRLAAALAEEDSEDAALAQAEERRLATARRAVLRAVAALGGGPGDDL